MEPTYSILYYLELQRQTLALAARDDHRVALAGAMASGCDATEKSEDESGENGEQSSRLDLSDLLVEAAREMDSGWLDFRPVESIKTVVQEALLGVFVLLSVAWFTWVCLFQAFLT